MMVDYNFVPPEIIMGEASLCGFWAMVAVAYVYQRNPKMNGWQEMPNIKATLAAMLWPALPDTSLGAKYVFSSQDLETRKVDQIIKDKKARAIYPCLVGELAFY
jgi:hypothetical protein